jgi:folate-dependent phosphoribosylglycinamide formyltransferase PurN
VTAELDVGPILEAVVPVLPGDTAATLAARVLTQEHVVYPRAVAQLLSKIAACAAVVSGSVGFWHYLVVCPAAVD